MGSNTFSKPTCEPNYTNRRQSSPCSDVHAVIASAIDSGSTGRGYAQPGIGLRVIREGGVQRFSA